MRINKAFKFRLYPNKAQREAMEKTFGCCRYVYNHFLRKRIDYYEEHGEGLTYHDTALQLTELKHDGEHDWLCEVNSQSLQQSLRDLDKAYNNFFNKRAGFPRFKSKRARQSFQVPQNFSLEDGKLKIPKIPGEIKVVVHRPVEGEIKYVTVSKTPSWKYYASLNCKVEIPEPDYKGHVMGIDLGLEHFAVTSDGDKYDSPRYLRKVERRLKRLQRRLSKKVKGSANYRKLRQKIAKLHEHIANQRKDFLHKLSRKLVGENQAIGLESLNVKGMMKGHHLAKSINDVGWGEFVRQLKYKGQWYGCRILTVDRFFPSTKRCSDCGYIKRLTLDQRRWVCPGCGAIHERDVNAARNILKFSTAGTAGSQAPGEDAKATR